MKSVLFSLLSLLAIGFTFSLSAGQPLQSQSADSSRTWAVVIGISKYPRLPGGQQLQFADRDATQFAEALKKAGVSAERLRLLAGADATASNIKSAIGNWVARSAWEQDTVIIYFSGHGLFEPEFKESYLLAYDSDLKDPYATAISVSDIKQALASRVRSRNVLIIADAVRRDLFDPETTPTAAESFVQSVKELASSRAGVSAIIASGPGEFSREGQRWGGHGAFTKHALDAMAGPGDSNSDGSINVDEFFNYLTARLSEDTSNKQHPWRSDAALAGLTISRTGRQTAASIQQKTLQSDSSIEKPPPGELDKKAVTKIAKPVEKAEQKPATPTGEKKDTITEKAQQIDQKATSPAAAIANKQAGSTATTSSPVASSSMPNREEKEPENKPSEIKSVEEKPKAETKAEQVVPRRNPTRPPTSAVSSDTLAINTPRREIESTNLPATSEASASNLPAPPRPRRDLPSTPTVTPTPDSERAPSLNAALPAAASEPSAVSLLMQLEAAIYANNLIEPKNASAWELYQRIATDPAAASGLQRLKPMLAEAMLSYGKTIVGGDVRADNIADKVEEFKKAGQVFARVRSLQPGNQDLAALEKLSAAQALIALQFYDEAERALSQAQGSRLAALENALGLTYQGKLDTWRAERAFKRAIEIDSRWAAPHYNLGLLYRSQQNQAAVEEFEQAARLDSGNVVLLAALGDEYFTRQQWDRAAETFKKAVALKPSDDTMHTKLGHALYSQGLHDEANRAYQKARELRARQQ